MSQVLHDHVHGQTNGQVSPRNPPGRRYGKPATTTDPAGLSAWATSILPVVENLRLLAEDATLLALYDERVEAAYGDYYKVARGFVRLISEPKVLSVLVGAGMRIRPLMEELLAIMANLMRNDKKGPAEVGYRAIQRLASAIPDQAWDLLFNETAGAPAI